MSEKEPSPAGMAAATEYLAHTLGKLARVDLTDEERDAAFRLACQLPCTATVRDFMDACDDANAIVLAIPAETIQTLGPLVAALRQGISYAGKFASLFEKQT